MPYKNFQNSKIIKLPQKSNKYRVVYQFFFHLFIFLNTVKRHLYPLNQEK